MRPRDLKLVKEWARGLAAPDSDPEAFARAAHTLTVEAVVRIAESVRDQHAKRERAKDAAAKAKAKYDDALKDVELVAGDPPSVEPFAAMLRDVVLIQKDHAQGLRLIETPVEAAP